LAEFSSNVKLKCTKGVLDQHSIEILVYSYLISIIFLDFSKAFDSLEWDFMLSTLKHYGFNYSFVTWVETLYNNIQTCVINNGWISEIFKNTRGVLYIFHFFNFLFPVKFLTFFLVMSKEYT
jgi:hypothetical protein